VHSHSFGGEYIELVPNERLRYTDKFDDPNLPGDIQVTVTLKTVSVTSQPGNIRQRSRPRARQSAGSGHSQGPAGG
jgi:uncharacterized protein YndB with AHSA1/START domain